MRGRPSLAGALPFRVRGRRTRRRSHSKSVRSEHDTELVGINPARQESVLGYWVELGIRGLAAQHGRRRGPRVVCAQTRELTAIVAGRIEDTRAGKLAAVGARFVAYAIAVESTAARSTKKNAIRSAEYQLCTSTTHRASRWNRRWSRRWHLGTAELHRSADRPPALERRTAPAHALVSRKAARGADCGASIANALASDAARIGGAALTRRGAGGRRGILGRLPGAVVGRQAS
jgi:hypothetical protein